VSESEDNPKGKTRASISTGSGLGVDFQGGPVIDPTENVVALTQASNRRQDDLRESQNELINEKIRAIKEVVDIRAAHTAEVVNLRADHSKELGALESNRLNAIRQVDVTAVKTEADRALGAIQTLAAQTATNAETLRTALVNTATTIAASTAGTVSGLSERIAALEKSTYEGVGKQRVADPMMAELVIEMKSLREARSQTTGKSEGGTAMWGYVAAGFGFLLLLMSIAGALVIFLKR